MNRDPRHLVRLKVLLRGVDSTGHPFKQTVFTHDVSAYGARLQETPPLLEPASLVEVQHRGRKARFRVIWVGGRGTMENSQVGLQNLEPRRCLWGSPLPGQPIYSSPPSNN